MREFKGRVLIPGNYSGEAVVTHTGFNPLATYRDYFYGFETERVCWDPDNKELYRKEIVGKVLCIPQMVGSSTAGLVMQTAAARGLISEVILVAKELESLGVCGLLQAEVWEGVKIICVDRLGDEFLEYVENGCTVEVFEDGTVRVNK